MERIKSINQVYDAKGNVDCAEVTFTSGRVERVTSKARFAEIQEQMKSQQKQVLMEDAG